MEATDYIGSLGVSILLLAYFLNITNRISRNGYPYIFMNFCGALLACIASILLHYIPFVILETVWAIVSLSPLFRKKDNSLDTRDKG